MSTDPQTQTPPMGLIGRVKAGIEVLRTGKLPNPLASEPKDRSRAALVKEWNDRWIDARKFWEPVFKIMESDMVFAGGRQIPDGVTAADGSAPYQADITQRHIMQRESQLYAKNPTFEARRRERLEFALWDETQESLDGARAILQQFGPQIDAAKAANLLKQHAALGVEVAPEQLAAADRVIGNVPPEVSSAQDILADYDRGMKQRAYEEAFGNTLRLLFQNQIDAQNPPFKKQAKQLVTRVNTCGVGYVKLLMRREITGTPTESAVKSGPADLLQSIQAKIKCMAEPDYEQDSSDMAELELMVTKLQAAQNDPHAAQEKLLDEGIVFDFLPATSVIVDKNCRSLRDFVGCRWICHEMLMAVEDCEREFNISLRDAGARMYSADGIKRDDGRSPEALRNADTEHNLEEDKILVGTIYDRATGMQYVLCDGVKDFLEEPKAPEPDWDYFFPILPLVFRPVEIEKNDPKQGVTCYPKSDVRLIRPMQKEYNRSGEEFVEARIASRAWWIVNGAKVQANDLKKLGQTRRTNEVIVVESLQPGDKLSDMVAAGPVPEIDPKVFDTSKFRQDMLEVIGSQQADLGPTNDDTATQARIAENARVESSDSNVDDLEDFFTMLAKGAGLMLMTMEKSTVVRLVGPGAAAGWPEVSMQEFGQNVWLQMQAGSSGRPNRQQDLLIAQQVLPLLAKLPGISPELLAKVSLRAVDPRLSLADFYNKNQPSIEALNAAASSGGQKEPEAPPPKAMINYKDAPPSIQRQMEQAEGYKPASEMQGTVHMDHLKSETAKPPATVAAKPGNGSGN